MHDIRITSYHKVIRIMKPRKPITLRLSPSEEEAITRAAERDGINRSAFIRRAAKRDADRSEREGHGFTSREEVTA